MTIKTIRIPDVANGYIALGFDDSSDGQPLSIDGRWFKYMQAIKLRDALLEKFPIDDKPQSLWEDE
jgi:hypothetical protein